MAAIKFLVHLLNFLLLAQLSQAKWHATCNFDPSKDLNETTIYLEANTTTFKYPSKSGSITLGGDDDTGLRLACPGGKVFVNGNPTEYTSITAECVGGSTVKLTGTYLYSPLNKFGCTIMPEPVVQLTTRKTPNGKKIAEIGFNLGLIDFLPVVNEISVSSFKSGYIPKWAHYKAYPLEMEKSNLEDISFKSGSLAAKIPFDEVYDATQQKETLMKIFDDEEIVDKYTSAGKNSFVPSQLVSSNEMFYEVQRNGAIFYENTIPVWSSIANGNWKYVNEIIKQITFDSSSDHIDVWSGTYLQLYLPNTQNKTTYLELPHGLKPAQFLFKYVHDTINKRGIVFITVNNPHLEETNKKNVICDKLDSCNTKYPEFANFEKGYTYCCQLKDFQSQAKKLGLPLSEDPAFF